MKRIVAILVCMLLIVSVLVGCEAKKPKKEVKVTDNSVKESLKPTTEKPSEDPKSNLIKVFCRVEEQKAIFNKYKELHPNFPYQFEFMVPSPTVEYENTADTFVGEPLEKKDGSAPDIALIRYDYNVEQYAKLQYAKYACPYEELGIDVNSLAKEGGMEENAIAMGKNPEGKVVALPYEGSAGAFFYRRSITKKVWGTDDPDVIEEKIGNSTESFLKAAEEVKKKGFCMVGGVKDLWEVIADRAETGWVVDGKVSLDAKREAFLDLAKTLYENGYEDGKDTYSDEWMATFQEKQAKVFGYFGTAGVMEGTVQFCTGGTKAGEGSFGDWGVCRPFMGFDGEAAEYVFVNKDSQAKQDIGEIVKWITLDASESGLQYLLASGGFSEQTGATSQVALSRVMENITTFSEALGGQNPFTVYAQLGKTVTKWARTFTDSDIDVAYIEQVQAYAKGKKSREQAIEDFMKSVQ